MRASAVVIDAWAALAFLQREASAEAVIRRYLRRAASEIVRTYIARKAMPRNPAGDALHLALASHHRCDFLVT